ncbi:MAG: sigma-70 family RNA polymerase sigma factor [Oscillospiraceae bacterium]|nr:sigma-70 family RNA polymerase sigma factor [Oscillospiraceae bacterium]MBR4101171.1 sigma-70 family RNA polymerase sigma factor [Oscillospiraceae bacterium]MBR6617299.1 sigma-70 family RNA polymerase sigma factor [Oscillospiraceae bacterium]
MKENTTALDAFRKYKNLVLRTAYCCVGDYSEAEDITQEVFLTLHNKQPEIRDDEHLKAWLLRCTMNRGRNYRKSWKQKGRLSLDEIAELTDEKTECEYGELRNMVLALPEKYAVVLYLYYYEGYQIPEIARLLGKRTSTVGSLLRRGREKLKSELEGAL